MFIHTPRHQRRQTSPIFSGLNLGSFFYSCIYLSVSMYLCIYLYMCMYLSVSIYICVCWYICIHAYKSTCCYSCMYSYPSASKFIMRKVVRVSRVVRKLRWSCWCVSSIWGHGSLKNRESQSSSAPLSCTCCVRDDNVCVCVCVCRTRLSLPRCLDRDSGFFRLRDKDM